jgi:phage terminase large subunit|tara:strand:+ start:2484 stop:3818 length:1335 start_codon:yes stop_codon:yes gene_type:complete
MVTKLQIPTAEVFVPLLDQARYKGAWGGRGSGKSHFFAGLSVEDALRWPGDAGEGLRIAAIREVQKSLKQSAKRLVEDKLAHFGLGEAQGFKVYNEVIELPMDGIMTFTGMQDHTADSVKSMEGYHRAWVEEAQSLSKRSLQLLRPTIRWENEDRGLISELWFGWNPELPTNAVDMLLRSDGTPSSARVVRANWSDNPWLPKVLDEERRDDLRNRPERYGHVWDGEYATVFEGAYYARHLTQAQIDGRIGFYSREMLNPVYAVWDIGSTSGKADATSIWIVQFINQEVRVLDYYEAVGQEFAAHVNWMRSKGYGEAICVLPHDGVKHDTIFKITPEGFLTQAGFKVETVPNQGAGAALMRIEAARQMFPACRFNEDTTEGGRQSLGWYHEKRDEKRNIGLGPNHDFASHAADAFGLVAVYRDRMRKSFSEYSSGPIRRNIKGIA